MADDSDALNQYLLAYTTRSDPAKLTCSNMDDYTSYEWYSCQFAKKMIFQVKERSSESRMLTIGPEPGKFAIQRRAKSDVWRWGQCVTNFKDETCFVIGGVGRRKSMLRSVSRYNIGKD